MQDVKKPTMSRVGTMLSMQQMDEPPKRPLVLNKDGLEDVYIPLFNSPSGTSAVMLDKIRSFGDLSDMQSYDPTLPSVQFGDSSSDGGSSPSSDSNSFDICSGSLFDKVLLSEWSNKQDAGLFRYEVSSCETKIINGRYSFVAQLNEGRALQKRPTEFRVDQVLQTFDDNKFNFTKASQEEVIFQFGSNASDHTSFVRDQPLQDETNMVLINVSPIEYGHVLLVPRILDKLPQQIAIPELLLAVQMAKSSDNPHMRVGYNSLGAYATINHLHFQAYYLHAPFPVERAPTKLLCTKRFGRKKGVAVSTVEDYPCRGIVFEGKNQLAHLAEVVGEACIRLQNENIPFNLLIVDCGSRIFLFPQCFAQRKADNQLSEAILDTQVNPAAFEICGHMVLKRKEDYEGISESFIWNLLEAASLDKDAFENVIKLCMM